MRRCNMCDDPYELEEFIKDLPIPKLMAEHGICYHCAFWLQRKRNDDEDKGIIPLVMPDWSHYTVPKDKIQIGVTEYHRWSLVAPSYAIITKDGQFLLTNNLYHQGTIPPRFHDRFEINAKVITDPVILQSIQDSVGVDKNYIKNLFENWDFSKNIRIFAKY